jgi:putative transposase
MRYRRSRIPGATHFFTVVSFRRQRLFTDRGAELFERALRGVRDAHPFTLEAQVILQDHLHALWTLPEGDDDYATRWRLIKSAFTRGYVKAAPAAPVSCPSRRAKAEREIWQRRYWEHLIRDERDFGAHLDYIHFNPVRHGLVGAPIEWPHSTFRQWLARGVYDPGWGSNAAPELPAWAGRE